MFVRETDALVDLYVDGEVISTTGEHPFWVPDLGWEDAIRYYYPSEGFFRIDVDEQRATPILLN